MEKITKLTKRNILSLFKNGFYVDEGFCNNYIKYNYIGIYENEIDFLERIYNLEEMPSFDDRYSNAKGDIYCHSVLNDDYESCWVFNDKRFDLCGDNDDKYLSFLCEIFNPYVRNENEPWEYVLDKINSLLKEDGYELFENGKISGQIKYGYRKYDPNNYKYIPFSVRHEQLLKTRKLSISIPKSIREKIKQLLLNSDENLHLTDETGFNYISSIFIEFFKDIGKFYEPKSFNENGEYVKTDKIDDFIMNNLPDKVFDIIEYYSYMKKSKDFEELVNYLFENNGLLFKLDEFRIEENKNVAISDTIDKAKMKDVDLKEIINSAQDLFAKNEKELACEKIWDAFERIKTFYYPEISSKKNSIECLINNISLNQDFNNLFDSEFRTLTEIGNKFRIRHHEKGKISIGDDSYYEYFYNRCLSLLILVIDKLDKE